MGLSLAMLLAATWQTVPLPFTLFSGEGERKHLPATTPGGIAVFDFDGDGLLDIFFANGAPLPSGRKSAPAHHNRMLRNRGGLRFEDVTASTGLAGTGYDLAASAADFDGDGRTDLLVCSLRGVTLYRNRASGGFEDVTRRAGLDNKLRWAVGAAWFDLENDGDLDLFLVNYVRWDAATERECKVDGKPDFCHPKFYDPEPNALFRNNGDGTFTDVSEASGIAAHKGKGMAVAAADFDLDGRTDLFVTNDRVFNFLFRNLGKGRFEERAFDLGVAVPASGNPPSSMGADAQDFDNDGRPDIIYTALRDETFPLYRNTAAEFVEAGVATRLGVLTRPMAGWGVAFADLDNDGWKDIAAARSDALSAFGPKGASAREPLSWFRSNGGKQFAAGDALPAATAMYRGLVAADFDRDGCLDVVATALQSQALLLRHACAGNWLAVDVRTPGARVEIAGQWRHQTSAVGYASSCACPLHFGLGARPSADVDVHWPNGQTRRITAVKANQILKVEP